MRATDENKTLLAMAFKQWVLSTKQEYAVRWGMCKEKYCSSPAVVEIFISVPGSKEQKFFFRDGGANFSSTLWLYLHFKHVACKF